METSITFLNGTDVSGGVEIGIGKHFFHILPLAPNVWGAQAHNEFNEGGSISYVAGCMARSLDRDPYEEDLEPLFDELALIDDALNPDWE